MTTTPAPRTHRQAAVPLWRDVRVLRIVGQVAVLAVVLILAWIAVTNLMTAMNSRNLGFGFGFLARSAGFEISESPIPYRPSDTYAKAFLVGLLNTLFISLLGIVLATILGLLTGIARLSPNWLLNRIAAAYVEVMRNTPLLVQLFILYFAVLLQLPSVIDAFGIGDVIFFSQRGVFMPAPQPQPGFGTWLALTAAGIAVAIGAAIFGARRAAEGHRVRGIGWAGIGVLLLLSVGGWILLGGPLAFDAPIRERFNFVGGFAVSPEFTALLVGLVLYTAAFIGEVVRGGIQAVRRGQLEAARALGLSEGQTLRLVVFPQALRIIVPPLTSQYLNLAKNSSLAIAIGYPDLFKVGQTMANQTGQPVPVIILVMGTYLAISLVTSALMNFYNRHVQVMER